MIVRNGFVSNSSSSSFVACGDKYKTTYELVEAMIKCREWETDDDLIEKMHRLVKECDHDPRGNAKINTCNYESYILWVPQYNVYAVQTTNNHDWSGIHNDMNAYDLCIPEINSYDDAESNIFTCGWFWDIENDILIKGSIDGYLWCSKDYATVVYINEDMTEKQCPICYVKKNPEKTVTSLYHADMIRLREESKNRPKRLNLRR